MEDDALIADLLRCNLQARGHDLRLAVDAQQLPTCRRPSLIDIHLPDLTGWGVLRIALQHGWHHHQKIEGEADRLPVVALSAVRVSPRRLAEFRPLAYMPKSLTIDAVLRLVAEAAVGAPRSHVEIASGRT